jgi:hypothetical protein
MHSAKLTRAEVDGDNRVPATIPVTVDIGSLAACCPCTAAAPIGRYGVHAERIGVA